jgi:hypothetical protein
MGCGGERLSFTATNPPLGPPRRARPSQLVQLVTPATYVWIEDGKASLNLAWVRLRAVKKKLL